MKKYGSLIALAVVIVLAIVMVSTKEKPVEKVKAPYSIAQVENLERIEITQPGESGGLVVLTKGEKAWTLTKPVDAPLADRVSEALGKAFSTKINTDDVKLDASKLEDFGLSDDKATKLALFPAGAQAPVAEFFIGKTFTVEGTRAKRTYIKTTDGNVYRAQTDVGDLLGKPTAELRSKEIQKLDRATIEQLRVMYQDETKNIVLKKDGEKWVMTQPQMPWELERTATSGLLNGMVNLTATGFVDDKTPADVGLDPWHVKVGARETGGETHVVLLSEVKDGKAYAMKEGGKHIFEIAENTAQQLTLSPLDLRSRLVKDLKKEEVARIDFGGEGVSVTQADGAWAFARGAKGAVKENALTSKLTALTQLRAVRFETPDPATTGLNPPAEKATVTMKDGSKHTLLVGGEADSKGNLWGKWQDVDVYMVVPQWVKERIAPKASELADEAS